MTSRESKPTRELVVRFTVIPDDEDYEPFRDVLDQVWNDYLGNPKGGERYEIVSDSEEGR